MTYQRITRRRSPQSIPALCIGLAALLMFGEAASAQRLHLSEAEQQRLRELVEKDEEAAALFDQVRQAADAALQQPPRPLREIHYEGLLDTDPRRVDTQKSLDSIDSTEPLMWAWIVTGDEAYADHAAAHVLAWAEKYEPTGNPINENKFEPLWLAFDLFEGRYSEQQRRTILDWFDEMARQEIASVERWEWSVRNNWHPKRLKVIAAAGRLLDDAEYVEYVERELLDYLDHALYEDGSSYDYHQRDALSYHSGGMRPVLRLAEMIDRHDLYTWENEEGGSMRRSVHFVVPFVVGEQEHQEFLETTVDLDRRRAEAGIERFQPGRVYEPRQAVTLFEKAGRFDPEIDALIPGLLEAEVERFATWQMVVNAARRAEE